MPVHDFHIPQLEMLASLQRQLCLCFAACALQPQHHLLRCFGLLMENGLCLTTVTRLLAVISALSLGDCGGLREKEDVNAMALGLREILIET